MEFLVHSLHQFLFYTFSICPNWGVAVALTSLLLKLAQFPLQRLIYRHQQKLALLQPRLDELRLKWSSEPQRWFRESRDLKKSVGLKSHGMIFGTIIQGFLMITIFKALTTFAGFQRAKLAWIPNLANSDPLFILPLISALFIWLQVKTSRAASPIPSWLVPCLSFLFTFKLTAGVALYYCASGVLQLASQSALNRWG